MTTHKESLWTLVRTAVHMWWNQRNIPPSSPALPPSQNPAPSENANPSPLIGWRAWVAKPDADGRYQLWSPLYETPWGGPTLNLGVAPAADTMWWVMRDPFSREPHRAFGLHAARDRATVDAYRIETDAFRATAFEPRELEHYYPVYGQVECFLAVAEYDKGWRAQAMTIQRLIIFTGDKRLKADLEDRYQCDVEVEVPALRTLEQGDR